MCFQVRYPLIFRSKPIQIISIPLHHLSAFFQIFSVVISTPYSVPFLMSQLLFYNVISEFILIQFSFIAYTIVWFFLLWNCYPKHLVGVFPKRIACSNWPSAFNLNRNLVLHNVAFFGQMQDIQLRVLVVSLGDLVWLVNDHGQANYRLYRWSYDRDDYDKIYITNLKTKKTVLLAKGRWLYG